MANSAGGTLIYGVDEEKATRTMHITTGVDPRATTTEWLEQVIDAGIQRRIEGLRVHAVELSTTSPGKFAYVVYVPQSNRAPHMAADGRYYKRLGTMADRMEEYEVRDVGRRSESPHLLLALELTGLPKQPDPSFDTSVVSVLVTITNTSPEPAFHAVGRLYIDQRLQPRPTT